MALAVHGAGGGDIKSTEAAGFYRTDNRTSVQ